MFRHCNTVRLASARDTRYPAINPSFTFPQKAKAAAPILPPWTQESFVDLDESDSSEDDDSSLSSLDSDDTVVSSEFEEDDVGSRLHESYGGSEHAACSIPITFTGSELGLQRPGSSPRGGRALPQSKAGQSIRWDEEKLAGNSAVRAHRSAEQAPLVVKPVAVAPLRSLNLTTPLRRHARSASLALRHDAALRNFQLKQEERQAQMSRERSDAELDIVGILSYPKPGPLGLQRSSSSAGCRRKEAARTGFHRHAASLPDIGAFFGIEPRQERHSPTKAADLDASVPPVAQVERERASAHLLKTLGGAQSQSKGVAKSPHRVGGRRRRPPSLDEITYRKCGSGASDRLDQQPRSASCPPIPPRPDGRDTVEVFVTPPTPRLCDTEQGVTGVVLLRTQGPAPMAIRQGHLAAPAFDIAPGRTRMLEESLRIAAELSRLVEQGRLISNETLMERLGQPTPPGVSVGQAEPVMVAGSFATGAIQRCPSDEVGAAKGNVENIVPVTVARTKKAVSTPLQPLAAIAAGPPPGLGPGPALADRTNSSSAHQPTAEAQRSSAAPVAKYVAPGRRGYGIQSGKGLPSTTAPRTPFRRHGGSISTAAPFDGEKGHSAVRSCSEAGGGATSRAAAGRTMLARLEMRRSLAIPPVAAAF